MANIIINKREGVTDEEALYYVSIVVRQGKISDNGNCFCYVTKFYDGVGVVAENKKADVFTVYKEDA